MPLGSAAAAYVLATATATPSTTTSTTTPIFLVPNGTFVVELVLFVVVLGIVAKFILPPLRGAMDERAQKVRSALQASEQGQVEAARLVTERRAVLDAARAEARSLLEQAAARAEALVDEAREQGQVEHDRIVAEARPRIDAERRRVEDELLATMGALVVAAAAQVVGAPLDADKHRTVVDEAVARVTGAGAPDARAENGA